MVLAQGFSNKKWHKKFFMLFFLLKRELSRGPTEGTVTFSRLLLRATEPSVGPPLS